MGRGPRVDNGKGARGVGVSDWVLIICSVIEAIGVIAALAWSVRQFRLETAGDREARLNERFAKLREEALLVNALTEVLEEEYSSVGTTHKCRVIVLKNGSPGPLSNVRIAVRWMSEYRDGVTYAAIPGDSEDRHYDVVTEGSWLIAEDKSQKYPWLLPVREDAADPHVPLFIIEDERRSGVHRILSVRFVDSYGNEWRRVYERCDGLDVGLHLVATPDDSLRRFVSSGA